MTEGKYICNKANECDLQHTCFHKTPHDFCGGCITRCAVFDDVKCIKVEK